MSLVNERGNGRFIFSGGIHCVNLHVIFLLHLFPSVFDWVRGPRGQSMFLQACSRISGMPCAGKCADDYQHTQDVKHSIALNCLRLRPSWRGEHLASPQFSDCDRFRCITASTIHSFEKAVKTSKSLLAKGRGEMRRTWRALQVKFIFSNARGQNRLWSLYSIRSNRKP